MIILQIKPPDIAGFPGERQTKISSHRNGVFTFAPALEWMKVKTGKVGVSQLLGAIQRVQAHADPDPVYHLTGDAFGIPGLEIPLEPSVFETPDQV